MSDSIDNIKCSDVESLNDDITIVDRIARDAMIEESQETTITRLRAELE